MLDKMPDKMQMIAIAFYMWAWILFQISSFFTFMLKMIIVHMPNYFIPSMSLKKTNINIIKAVDDNSNDITNKIKLFMNLNWDKEAVDEKGGIDLDKFTEYIKSSCIWILYFIESDFDDNIDKTAEILEKIKKIIKKKRDIPSAEALQTGTVLDEMDISDSNDTKVLSETVDIYAELKSFVKYIRLIVVNTEDKYTIKVNDKQETELEDILFGEVNFFD
jgi:hypothetical protein